MVLHRKLAALRKLIGSMDSLAVAYSGGVDSTFLLKVAHEILGDRAIAVTAQSSTYPAQEFKAAIDFTSRVGIRQLVIGAEELDIEGFAANPLNRCYLCKRHLFTQVIAVASQHNIEFVADGTNADDSEDYRPGLKALDELGILSPLQQQGITKQEIRDISRVMGLPTWDKPDLACLASRFPYGQLISREKLAAVEQAEQILLDQGFRQVRVRHHGDIARIEVSPEERIRIMNAELMDQIYEQFQKLGFQYTALDLKGYRMGSMNEKTAKLCNLK